MDNVYYIEYQIIIRVIMESGRDGRDLEGDFLKPALAAGFLFYIDLWRIC